jgi:hypothetical protein
MIHQMHDSHIRQFGGLVFVNRRFFSDKCISVCSAGPFWARIGPKSRSRSNWISPQVSLSTDLLAIEYYWIEAIGACCARHAI